MDISGSLMLLILGSPILLMVAVAVKASSKGPILYRQRRIGQYGKTFTFLKFRSMYVDNDASVHREYVMQLIAGQAQRHPANGNGDGTGFYKLTNDKRITPIGAFLRRTSIDELPQLFNVLRAKCRWWARARRFLMRLPLIRLGTAGGCWRSNLASPGYGKLMAEGGWSLMIWFAWIFVMPGNGRLG